MEKSNIHTVYYPHTHTPACTTYEPRSLAEFSCALCEYPISIVSTGEDEKITYQNVSLIFRQLHDWLFPFGTRRFVPTKLKRSAFYWLLYYSYYHHHHQHFSFFQCENAREWEKIPSKHIPNDDDDRNNNGIAQQQNQNKSKYLKKRKQ